jgi:hypothetical protein
VQAAPVATTLILTSSPNPSMAAAPVNFQATISFPGTPGFTPSGFVQVMDGSAAIATAQVYGPVVSLSASPAAGTHALTAVYSGDSHFLTSTSPVLSQVVNPAGPKDSTVTIASSPNPANLGGPLTLTATVSPAGATGVVGFNEYGQDTVTSWGSATLVNGTATVIIPSLPNTVGAGTHSVQADYRGDANYKSSSSVSLSQQVLKQAATVSLASNMNPGIKGIQFPITATVAAASGSAQPSGYVQLFDGTTSRGTVNVVNGVAQFSISFDTTGTHVLTASYPGDANFLGATSQPLNEVVKNMTHFWKTTSTPSPGIAGFPITLTLYITDTDATGTVDFVDGISGPNIYLGTGTLINGTASITTSVLTAGTHEIYATYSGDANYISGATPSLQVVKAASTAALTATPATAVYGQAVQLTAAVAPASTTGTVQFLDGATPLGTVPVSNGAAVLSVPSFSAGAHSVTATYSGDATYGGSTSAPVAVSVAKATPSIAISSSLNPAPYMQAIIFTIALTPANATGGVQLLDGATVIATLAAGTTTASVTLNVGTHSVTAVYGGDANFNGATSAPVSQLVTTTTLTSVSATPANSTYGQPVQLTAAVTPTPTGGTVQFLDGAAVLGTVPVSNGAAAMSVGAFSASTHAITAVYSGDGAAYLGSTSAAFTLTVNQAATTVTLWANPNPAIAGTAVYLTAAVSPPTATGTIQFLDGSTVLGSVAMLGGSASLTVSTFAVGPHAIKAVYGGDGAGYLGSTSAVAAETVNKAATTAALAASPNPATAGTAVTLSAAVSPATATGTVQFLDGATVVGTVPVSGGVAVLTVTSFAAGTHSITATYSGDANNSGSTSAVVAETVNKAATTAALVATPNPATAGTAVTLSAAVSPATATGTVQFLDGATVLGAATLNRGLASLTTSTLAAGTHSITAAYSGDANNSGSTSAAVAETVNKAATTATLAASPNPAAAGTAVTLSAAVSPATATGTVQFLDGATVLGAATLNHGAASLTTSTLAAGSHALTAAYSGDATDAPATSAVLTLSVVKTATTAALTSSQNPSVSGRAVTFTGQVSPSAATGSIQFKDGSSLLGTVTVSGGSAALAISTLSVGAHSITAIYSGDANYTGSTSTALSQTVTAPPPGAPSNLTATAVSASQINLAWTASGTSGVTYNVYSATTSGFTPSGGNRIATGLTATSYSHSGLAPSTVHYYLVTAQNSAGESTLSNQASATTQSGVSCHVGYTVTTQWNVGFGTAITIKNTGSKPINGWNLTWTWAGNQQITEAWNSNYTQNGKNASLTNASWNPTIAAGATLSGMGFNGSYSVTNTAPTAFYVNGTLCQ